MKGGVAGEGYLAGHEGAHDVAVAVDAGEGVATVDGVEYQLRDGFALLVPAGAEHNIKNIGSESLKLYTIYTPANHIDGRVHATKADAIADEEDEAYGHQ